MGCWRRSRGSLGRGQHDGRASFGHETDVEQVERRDHRAGGEDVLDRVRPTAGHDRFGVAVAVVADRGRHLGHLFSGRAELVHVPLSYEGEVGGHVGPEGVAAPDRALGTSVERLVVALGGAATGHRSAGGRRTAHQGDIAESTGNGGGRLEDAACASGVEQPVSDEVQGAAEVAGPGAGVAGNPSRAGEPERGAVDVSDREAGVVEGTSDGLPRELEGRQVVDPPRLPGAVHTGDCDISQHVRAPFVVPPTGWTS